MPTEAETTVQRLAKLESSGRLANDHAAQDEALQLSKKLQFTLQKPADAAIELGFWPSYTFCARVAVGLNLFALISSSNGPVTLADLAQKSGGEELLIVRVLRGLVAVGFVNEAGKNQWTANELTRIMCAPPIASAHIHFWDRGVRTMTSMPDYFKAKGWTCPTDPENGALQFAFNTDKEAFNYWHQDPEILDIFNTFMEGNRGSRPSWVEWFPVKDRILDGFDGTGVLLTDVAGGRGHDVEAFRSKFFDHKGKLVLQDLPAVIDDIKTLDSSIDQVKYDFFTPQTVKGARVYFFHFIFHDWSDEVCLRILSNTVQAMKKGHSKLILNELIIPDQGCPPLPVGFDMNMMAMHAGQERTVSQWTDLLAKVGLKPKFYLNPSGGEGIVEADFI